MPRLDCGDWTLAYDVSGEQDAPAALLLHDIPDDRRVWRDLARNMGEDFCTIVPDLRGFGESGAPSDLDTSPELDQYAGDLAALLSAEGIETCTVVVGSGFGAEVALQLALSSPERIEFLVLSGANPVSDHPTYDGPLRAREALLAEQGGLARRFGMARAANRATEHLTRAYIRSSIRGRYKHVEAAAFASAHEARASRNAALLTQLSSLTVPTLIVTGENDPLLPAAHLLAKTLPNGRLVTLSRCGHGAPFVAPRDFEAALGAFLGDVRTTEVHA